MTKQTTREILDRLKARLDKVAEQYGNDPVEARAVARPIIKDHCNLIKTQSGGGIISPQHCLICGDGCAMGGIMEIMGTL